MPTSRSQQSVSSWAAWAWAWVVISLLFALALLAQCYFFPVTL